MDNLQAQAFVEKAKSMERPAYYDALDTLSQEDRALVRKIQYEESRREMDKFFVPENAGERYEKLSPDGKYKLVVTSYTTGKGYWNYTQGLVYQVGENKPIFEVRRNYHGFPFQWIDGHTNGHQYLVCGEDYQGQTVLELDTGKRRDFMPSQADYGCGFCWVDYKFDAPSLILTVCGCHWACPYEYRLYDFSDPMNGWPGIEIVDGYLVPKDLDNLLTYRTFPSVLPGMTYMSVNVTVERTHLAGGCAKG